MTDSLNLAELELLRQSLISHMHTRLTNYGLNKFCPDPDELLLQLLKKPENEPKDQYTVDQQLILTEVREWQQLNQKLVHLEQILHKRNFWLLLKRS
ncbi:hypothetical protein HMPREF0497_2898 [Lentilactobacillus buchneri ATCC 11577]|nr:hypothetical protein HMPREF0497_2898 [Lentilactobacillus buchneri ATCC 11577]